MDVPILIAAKSRKEPGAVIEIDCPRCGAAGVAGAPYRQVDNLCAFYFLPLFTIRNTFVECTACRTKLRSSVDLDELLRSSQGELNDFLSHDVSFVVKFLAIASLVLCLAPIAGFALSILTVLLTLKTAGWPRTLGRISLIISGLVMLAFVGLLAMGK
ncbi:MAG TPA: hypothetical protein VN699_04200 [Pirellulales bacterium]|nr:hypothetical protein [Pirellulales bacterium]